MLDFFKIKQTQYQINITNTHIYNKRNAQKADESNMWNIQQQQKENYSSTIAPDTYNEYSDWTDCKTY